MKTTCLLIAALAMTSGCELLPGNSGPPGPRGLPGERGEPGGTDGLRLKRRVFKGGDFSMGVVGWRDSTMGHVCTFVPVPGGLTCAPPDVQTTNAYGDAGCELPIVLAVVPGSDVPWQWWADVRETGAYQLAQDMPLGALTWQWVDGACVPGPLCEEAECIALLPASSLITVEIATE